MTSSRGIPGLVLPLRALLRKFGDVLSRRIEEGKTPNASRHPSALTTYRCWNALSLAVLVVCSLNVACGQNLASLQQAFVHPPDSARLWVNWFWMDGNITREGITADLEAMARVGIGGVLLMDIS